MMDQKLGQEVAGMRRITLVAAACLGVTALIGSEDHASVDSSDCYSYTLSAEPLDTMFPKSTMDYIFDEALPGYDIQASREVILDGRQAELAQVRDQTPEGYELTNMLVLINRVDGTTDAGSSGIFESKGKLYYVSIGHIFDWNLESHNSTRPNQTKPSDVVVYIPRLGAFSAPNVLDDAAAVDLMIANTDVPQGLQRGDPVVIAPVDRGLEALIRQNNLRPMSLATEPVAPGEEVQMTNPATGTFTWATYRRSRSDGVSGNGSCAQGLLVLDSFRGSSAAVDDTNPSFGTSGLPIYVDSVKGPQLVSVNSGGTIDTRTGSTRELYSAGL